MRAGLGECVDETAVAATLHERPLARCEAAETDEWFAGLLADWRELAVTPGERVRATRHGGSTVAGTAVEVTAAGALVVEGEDGSRTTLTEAAVERLRPERG